MPNHPHRSRGPYTANVSCSQGWPTSAEFPTIRECRAYAESYGRTDGDRCEIVDAKGRVVGLHLRDTSSDGLRWFRATP
jgi:hypothetical protein